MGKSETESVRSPVAHAASGRTCCLDTTVMPEAGESRQAACPSLGIMADTAGAASTMGMVEII